MWSFQNYHQKTSASKGKIGQDLSRGEIFSITTPSAPHDQYNTYYLFQYHDMLL